MNPFEVKLKGRPRSTVHGGSNRQYESDICVTWNMHSEVKLHQSLKQSGIEMVLANEEVARDFMDKLLVAFHNVTVKMHA